MSTKQNPKFSVGQMVALNHYAYTNENTPEILMQYTGVPENVLSKMMVEDTATLIPAFEVTSVVEDQDRFDEQQPVWYGLNIAGKCWYFPEEVLYAAV